MPGKAFFDTNILIYAFAERSAKADIAEGLLAGGGALSVQVLDEFAHVCRRTLSLSWDEIDARIDVLRALLDAPSPVTLDTHETARDLARTYGFSFYDALIVAAAQEVRAETLLTEDLQHGRRVGEVTIRNPFVDG